MSDIPDWNSVSPDALRAAFRALNHGFYEDECFNIVSRGHELAMDTAEQFTVLRVAKAIDDTFAAHLAALGTPVAGGNQ
jgi:hypothetical protein